MSARRQHQILWVADFLHIEALPRFPRLLRVAEERCAGEHYRYAGTQRGDEPHCIFQYTITGEGRFRRDQREWVLPSGHAFLCHSHDPACAYWHPAGADPWHLIFAAFTGDTADQLVDDWLARHGPVTRCADEDVLALLRRWRRPCRQQLPLSPARSLEWLAGFFALLERNCNNERADDRARCQRIIIDMSDHLGDELGIAELAQRHAISREHLTRLFHRHIGESPARYLRRLRLAEAVQQLVGSAQPIQVIARDCGFGDPAHFSRVCKRRLGMTPSQCRQRGVLPMV